MLGVKLKVLGYPTPLVGLEGNPSYDTSTVAKVCKTSCPQRRASLLILLQIEYAAFMMQPLALGSTKLSFVFFYRRIFLSGRSETATATAFNIATLSTIGIATAWMISFFFTYVFVCGSHPAVYWESTKASSAHCFKTRVALDGFAISDFLTDLIVLVLPIPMVGYSYVKLATCLRRAAHIWH